MVEVPAAAAPCGRKLHLPTKPRREGNPTPLPGLQRLIEEARRAKTLVDGNRESPISEIGAPDATKGRSLCSHPATTLRLILSRPSSMETIRRGSPGQKWSRLTYHSTGRSNDRISAFRHAPAATAIESNWQLNVRNGSKADIRSA